MKLTVLVKNFENDTTPGQMTSNHLRAYELLRKAEARLPYLKDDVAARVGLGHSIRDLRCVI